MNVLLIFIGVVLVVLNALTSALKFAEGETVLGFVYVGITGLWLAFTVIQAYIAGLKK